MQVTMANVPFFIELMLKMLYLIQFCTIKLNITPWLCKSFNLFILYDNKYFFRLVRGLIQTLLRTIRRPCVNDNIFSLSGLSTGN